MKKGVRVPSVSQNQKINNHYALVIQYVQECGFFTGNAVLNWARETIADPWLIATAMNADYKIVTFEKPSGNLSRKTPQNNPKIPDVARYFGVQCISLFDFMRETKFKL